MLSDGLDHPHVLVIEDDRDILDAIQLILRSKGYVVSGVGRADKLDEVLAGDSPDLILLDIWVGGGDGREIAQRLKREEATRQVPIVLVSANISTPQIAKDVKADDFILKPFDMDHLLAVVEKQLKKSKLGAKS